ncbi:MAG: TolC family protein [Longimicrobiales bacterium]
MTRGLLGALLCAALAAQAALMPARLGAQAVRELTVEESVQMGLEHNARLRAASADVDAARAGERQVGAARLPALRSQASYGRLSNNIPGVEFSIPGYDSTFTFQGVQLDRLQTELSLELPLLAQLRLGHEARAAGHDVAAVALGLEQERSDVAFDIRRAYWNLHRAQEHRATVQAALAGVEAHLQVVRERVTEGAALTRDLLAAQTRRSEVLLEQVEADNAVRVGQLELNRLIGFPLDEPLRPVSEPPAVPAPGMAPTPQATGAGLVSSTVSDGRPRIAALERQVLGLRERLGAAGASRLPEVDFYARWLYAKPNPYFFMEQDRFNATWELGLSGRWAIWEGGAGSARQQEARSRLEAAEARLQDTAEQVAVETARLRLEVRRAAEAVGVAEQNVGVAEESFRVVGHQFEEGAALSADVLDAEEALRRARARRADALADHAIAEAALLNALGRVW